VCVLVYLLFNQNVLESFWGRGGSRYRSVENTGLLILKGSNDGVMNFEESCFLDFIHPLKTEAEPASETLFFKKTLDDG
jgi:hypothetical protein